MPTATDAPTRTELATTIAARTAPLAGLGDGELLIHELYQSIQGESTFAGLPCAFVRTSVCDLRCAYCDTPHAFKRGTRRGLESVLAEVLALGCPLVEVTGGEPLLQPAVLPLMSRLADAGRTVLLETSGAHPTDAVDDRVRIILDVKCPGSGEAHRNHWPNLARLRGVDEVKFVLADRADFDYALSVICEHALEGRAQVLMSTVFGGPEPREVVEWLLAEKLWGVRFQLQMHKYIWHPKARGV